MAAYGNGHFANHDKAKAQFPHAHLLKIDVNGQGIGNAGDFEVGDMALEHAGHWAKGRIHAGIHRPVVYFAVSNWRTIMHSLHAAGSPAAMSGSGPRTSPATRTSAQPRVASGSPAARTRRNGDQPMPMARSRTSSPGATSTCR